jgi:RNA polymerase sigma-70 factor (ECF subfamily)
MRVFEALPRLKADGAPLEHWMSRIALNVCRKRWRSQSRRPEWRWSDLSEGEQQAFLNAQRDDEPLEGIETREARSLMHKLLDTLSADDRMILSLLHLEEKSLEEIAQVMGISRIVVKVRAFRARLLGLLHWVWVSSLRHHLAKKKKPPPSPSPQPSLPPPTSPFPSPTKPPQRWP